MVGMNQLNFKLTQKPLESYVDTVKQVFRLARTYFLDLLDLNKYEKNLALMEPKEFFNFVRSMEYVKDPSKIEFVNRPKISIALSGTGHPFDCDDRTVLSLSYFMLINELQRMQGKKHIYDYRVLVVGRSERPHHIYIEYKNKNSTNWIPFDPTYPHNEYGIKPFEPGFLEIFYEKDFYYNIN